MVYSSSNDIFYLSLASSSMSFSTRFVAFVSWENCITVRVNLVSLFWLFHCLMTRQKWRFFSNLKWNSRWRRLKSESSREKQYIVTQSEAAVQPTTLFEFCNFPLIKCGFMVHQVRCFKTAMQHKCISM